MEVSIDTHVLLCTLKSGLESQVEHGLRPPKTLTDGHQVFE